MFLVVFVFYLFCALRFIFKCPVFMYAAQNHVHEMGSFISLINKINGIVSQCQYCIPTISIQSMHPIQKAIVSEHSGYRTSGLLPLLIHKTGMHVLVLHDYVYWYTCFFPHPNNIGV